VYVIVVGCGQIGYQLTKALLASNNEVVVIERDSRVAEQVAEEMGSVVIASDGTEPSVLQEAGANRCDVLVATTGSDANNLAACQVAKNSFHVPQAIAVVHDPQHVPLFNALGVDVTINTTDLILSHIEGELPTRPLVHLMPLKNQHQEVVSVRLPADSALVGQAVRTVPVPAGTTVLLIVGKDGRVRTMASDLRFEAEDQVVAITTPEFEDKLWQALSKAK